ncbi:hypothetical protein ACWGOQ_0013050 [Aquimarina sp. M1]
MKNITRLKIAKIEIFSFFLLLLLFTNFKIIAQYSNNFTRPAIDRTSSNKARVIFFNDDQSNHENENLYVSYGKKSDWWKNIKLEVQKEGMVGTRSGMFADWGNLYLVGDWDNNSTNEDIVFGFNSNLRSSINEKMRLTDEGLLGLGTNAPKGMLHVTGDTYSKGHVYLYAYQGDGKSGTAFIQARDKSYSSNIGLQLRTQNGGDIVDALKIMPNGNVGIGTTEPQQKFQVEGNSLFNGKTTINNDLGIKGNTSVNGDLTLTNVDQSQNLIVNKGLNIRLTNIPDSHFSIQNAFGADALYIDTKGNIAIGSVTNELTEQLQVAGRIKASGFVADASSFPDYVFSEEYELIPLEDVKAYTNKHQSLPGMPTEKEVISNGLDIKQVTIIAVEKIEELYLHTIKQEELIKKQQDENNTMKRIILELQQRITLLEEHIQKK